MEGLQSYGTQSHLPFRVSFANKGDRILLYVAFPPDGRYLGYGGYD